MVYYDSADIYIQSCTTIREKIARIDAIITALENTALKAAANDNITEYSLNDGQTIIRTVYKGADAVLNSIAAFEKIRQMYINRLNGRVMRLVDGKNFTGRGNGR
jgi:hypothetical protein